MRGDKSTVTYRHYRFMRILQPQTESGPRISFCFSFCFSCVFSCFISFSDHVKLTFSFLFSNNHCLTISGNHVGYINIYIYILYTLYSLIFRCWTPPFPGNFPRFFFQIRWNLPLIPPRRNPSAKSARSLRSRRCVTFRSRLRWRWLVKIRREIDAEELWPLTVLDVMVMGWNNSCN